MRLVSTGVGFVLVARLAHAQASVEQLARCAAIPAAALRLQCYDTLTKPNSDSASRSPRDGPGTGMVPTGNEVFMEAIVEEKPAVLSGPKLQYPELLRQGQNQGRAPGEGIIGT